MEILNTIPHSNIIARGEVSDHAHIIIGDAEILQLKEDSIINNKNINKGTIIINVNSKATIKHLIESVYVNEQKEVWTKEHKDIPLKKGTYIYIPQLEIDPYTKLINSVKD